MRCPAQSNKTDRSPWPAMREHDRSDVPCQAGTPTRSQVSREHACCPCVSFETCSRYDAQKPHGVALFLWRVAEGMRLPRQACLALGIWRTPGHPMGSARIMLVHMRANPCRHTHTHESTTAPFCPKGLDTGRGSHPLLSPPCRP